MAGEQPSTPARSLGRFLLIGGVAVSLAQLLAQAAGFAGQAFLARLLQPEEMAAYFLTIGVVEVIANASQTGLPRPVTRLVAAAEGTGRARGVLVTAYLVVACASLGIALIYLTGAGAWLSERVLGSPIMATGAVVTALWITARGFQNLAAGGLRGFHMPGAAALFGGALGRLVTAVVFGTLLFTGGSVGFLPAIWIVAGTVWLNALVASLLLARRVSGAPTDRPEVRLLLAAGLPLLANGLLVAALNRADLWIVGGLFTQQDVVLYGAAKRIIALVSMPLLILNLVIPPVIAELHAKGEIERLTRAVRGTATLAALPSLLLVLALMVGSEEVLGLAFGDFYRAGAWILVILALERIVFVWTGPCGMVLIMSGHERAALTITVTAGMVKVAATLGGALWMGFRGVAIGFVLGSLVHQGVSWYLTWRWTGVRTDVDPLNLRAMLEALQRTLAGVRR